MGDREAGAAGRDPLIVQSIEFLGGMASDGGWRPDPGLPEVAFAGRSNVGKSSLINRLLRRRKIARVSNTPGRTREINFFRINDAFILADLPGYGYARVSKERRAEWRPLIGGYLRRSPALRGIVQLLDVRHDPTPEDVQMLEFLEKLQLPAMFVVTKVDKLVKSRREARVAEIAGLIGVPLEQVIMFSAETGEGRDELAAAVAALVASPPPDAASDEMAVEIPQPGEAAQEETRS
jgi:GTP-binding protein